MEGVQPSLEFVITSRDITGTGAPATLLVFNNEKGFSPKNIESICSVGRSTKKGFRKRGYIGEKGNYLMSSNPCQLDLLMLGSVKNLFGTCGHEEKKGSYDFLYLPYLVPDLGGE